MNREGRRGHCSSHSQWRPELEFTMPWAPTVHASRKRHPHSLLCEWRPLKLFKIQPGGRGPGRAKQEASLAAEGFLLLSKQSPGSVSKAVLPTLESLGPYYPLRWGTASEGCLSDTPPQACLQSCWGKNPCQAALLQGVGRANQLLDSSEGPISSQVYQGNLNTAFLIPCMAHRVGETNTPECILPLTAVAGRRGGIGI